MKKKDFYMVLPSNSLPNVSPENNAADFIVNWQQPIELDPSQHWQVALIDVSYTYEPHTLTPTHGIRYVTSAGETKTTVFRDFSFNGKKSLVHHLKVSCKHIFEDISVPNNGYISFKLKANITTITFLGGLHFVLGFRGETFNAIDAANDTFKAEFKPQLDRGDKIMYIYASCCAPIYVGPSLVPLLRNVFIDTSDDADQRGYMRNQPVILPMYMDVASTCFSHIEINIRDSGGNLIAFPEGAETILNLHFKKEKL